jgi:hypothetical protein
MVLRPARVHHQEVSLAERESIVIHEEAVISKNKIPIRDETRVKRKIITKVSLDSR